MKEQQVGEKELQIPALKIVEANPNINTSQLIKELEKVVKLYPKDREIIKNRNDNYFSQTVRNLCGSHLPTNEFGKCVTVNKVNNVNCFRINNFGLAVLNQSISLEMEDVSNDEIFQNQIQKVEVYDNKNELDKSIQRKPELSQGGKSLRYKTDPRIAKTVLKNKNYICEYAELLNEEHKTFTSKAGVSFMEGHHLIPIKAQKDFTNNIDRPENIISLCPICHRAVHNACGEEKIQILKKIYDSRIEDLKKAEIAISFEDLYNKYYI